MAFNFWQEFRHDGVITLIALYTLATVLVVGVAGFWGDKWVGAGSHAPSPVADESFTPAAGGGLTNDEMHLIARVIEGEAANEPYKGKVAVAAVVLNRVEHAGFPDSVQEVVFQPRAFCVVANGLINRTPSEKSVRAAQTAVRGKDPTGGALYFWNPNKRVNSWMSTRVQLVTLGNHVFAR